jgi:hypothetical protein
VIQGTLQTSTYATVPLFLLGHFHRSLAFDAFSLVCVGDSL